MPSPSETNTGPESALGDGGPAFPRPDWNGSWNGPDSFTGMSLRQWYAGMAMTSVAASIMKAGAESGALPAAVAGTIAAVSVELADALILAERAKAVR